MEMKEKQLPQNLSFRNAYISSMIVVLWAVIFGPTLVATVTIWSTSETFTHGFVILPIVGWLLWRDRQQFLGAEVTGSYCGAAMTLLFIFLWLVGQALEISVFRQLGLFGAIAASHWMVFGGEFAKRYKFPLCYLIFAVPLGNAIIPLLQHITAEITVLLLQLSQIPVYYEGLYITIPTGKFEVAVACSGIRYLIASLAVGTLYAYLNYRYFYKQVLFIALSIIVPIVANGIRAYLIVIIAHLSDMKYATGADHLIYGWLFFGVVIALMFYLGSLFADDDLTTEKSLGEKYSAAFNIWPIVIVIPFTLLALFVNHNIDAQEPPQSPETLLISNQLGMSSLTSSLWGINFNDALAIFSGANTTDDDKIELYVAKFANRQTRGELLTSTNRLYDIKYWSLISQVSGQLVTTNGDVQYIDLQLVSARGQQRLVRYTYAIDDKYTADQAQVRLYQGMLVLKNTNSPVFVIAISVNHQADATGLSQAKKQLSQWLVKHPLSLIRGA
jgi:exosortase A